MSIGQRAAWVGGAGLLWAALSAAHAQPAAPVPGAAGPVSPSSAAAAPLELRVIEDDAVRIEETRQRGQLRRIMVHSKVAGARPYEILVGAGGRDPSLDRSGAGQRVWSLFTF